MSDRRQVDASLITLDITGFFARRPDQRSAQKAERSALALTSEQARLRVLTSACRRAYSEIWLALAQVAKCIDLLGLSPRWDGRLLHQ